MFKKITNKPGKYIGSGQGKEDLIKVEVDVGTDKINNIKILNDYQPDSLADQAFTKMSQRILTNQSVSVDVISGASETSRGVIAGVKDALKKANVDLQA
ncbi:FMN-binding protein, partial [Lactobacillus sp. XV13L]|nr:FMN-binding protein [Lactobacillus sp. XV13L]